MLGDTDFVVTWDECGPDARCELFGQRFSLAGPTHCPGDCNLDGSVTIDELVLAANTVVTAQPDLTRRCLPADTNLDYTISVDELVAAVSRTLGGCP